MPIDSPRRSLQELIATDSWHDCFAGLSECLGFTLRVFSSDGKLLSGRLHAASCCGVGSWPPGLLPGCESHCRPVLQDALAAGKQGLFPCRLKAASFVVPFRYRQDEAVILGQGSFSSSRDFQEGTQQAALLGLDVRGMAAPAEFTSDAKARMVCAFTAAAVRTLLVGRGPGRLKNFVGASGMPAEDQPDALYRCLLKELPPLINADGVSLFVLHRQNHRYMSLAGVSNGTDGAGLSENGVVVQGLTAGNPFVLSAEPAGGDDGGMSENSGLYFFPIMAHGRLEAIVCTANRTFNAAGMQITGALCRQTGLALENGSLRRDLSDTLARFSSVSELARSITPIHNFQALLRKILDESAGLIRAEQGSLMLLDEPRNELLLSVKKGPVEGLSGEFRVRCGEGIAGKVAREGESLLVQDLERDRRIMQKNREHYKTRSFVSIPLKIDRRVIGVLNLADKTTGEVFNEEDLSLIQAFATHAAVVMERNRFLSRSEELERLSVTDPLTGLANRRYLFERLKEELARAERHGRRVSLVMIDLDGFKLCNDTLGHPYGDRVLKDIALAVLKDIRSMDIASRYGGDEFMVILPETGEAVAVDIAERIRTGLQRTFPLKSDGAGCGENGTITASIGIVCYPDHGSTVEQLLKNVDEALYRAKESGRNRTVVYPGRFGIDRLTA